jgi:hypothetical protein
MLWTLRIITLFWGINNWWVLLFFNITQFHKVKGKVKIRSLTYSALLKGRPLLRAPCTVCPRVSNSTIKHFKVKRVSWFKSSLFLRINIQHTHKLQFWIKTKDSIFNRKVNTTGGRIEPSVAWLVKIETGSILIKEKHKHLSKMMDRVSRKCFRVEKVS